MILHTLQAKILWWTVVGHQFKNVIIQGGAQILNLLSVFVLMQQTDVSFLGVYGIARALFGLLEYSHLGTRFGIDLGFSVSERKKRERMLDASYKIILLVGYPLSLFFLFQYEFGASFQVYLLTIPLMLVVNAYRLSLRAANEIDSYLHISFVYNLMLYLGGFILICLGNIDIYFGGLSVLMLGLFFYLFISGKIYISFSRLNLKLLKKLIFSGLPLFLFGLAILLLLNLERYFYVNEEFLELQAQLTIYLMFIGLMSVVPNAIIEIVQTRLLKLDKSDSESVSLRSDTVKKLFVGTAFVLVLALAGAKSALTIFNSQVSVSMGLLICSGIIAFCSSILSLEFFGAYRSGVYKVVLQTVMFGLLVYLLIVMSLRFFEVNPTIEIVLLSKLFAFVFTTGVCTFLKENEARL